MSLYLVHVLLGRGDLRDYLWVQYTSQEDKAKSEELCHLPKRKTVYFLGWETDGGYSLWSCWSQAATKVWANAKPTHKKNSDRGFCCDSHKSSPLPKGQLRRWGKSCPWGKNSSVFGIKVLSHHNQNIFSLFPYFISPLFSVFAYTVSWFR